ncbi:MAG: oxidoreductase [Verrucomicrobiales bacterium]|nr:oxidoreductase [Verrucomicrobiales bacterium]
MRFDNKVAIVSGGSSGIGLATAKRLGSEGARVVLIGRNKEKVLAAAEETKRAGAPDAFGLVCNVAEEPEVEAAVRATIDRFGRFDVMVNNAGLMIFKPLEEQTAEDWRSVLNVDLLGAFYFIRQAFFHMSQGGSIVNVSSIHAIETTPLVSAYAAAKAALISLTRSASMEGTSRGIRVNAILPGAVNTPMLWNNPNVKSGLEQIDRGMLGTPEDVASVIAFLASDEAAFVRGSSVIVDGGRLGKL